MAISAYLDAMLKAVELPSRVANLDACLADMNGDALSHCGCLSDLLNLKKKMNLYQGALHHAFQKQGENCNGKRSEVLMLP